MSPIALAGHTLKKTVLSPTRCTLQYACTRLDANPRDPVLTLKFPCDRTLVVHRSHLVTASPPLRALVSPPFRESTSDVINLSEKFESFKLIRAFLYCVPIDLENVAPDVILAADRWGLLVLFEACFIAARCEEPDLVRLLSRWLPIMALVSVPTAFKRHFVSAFVAGLEDVEDVEGWLASWGAAGRWRGMDELDDGTCPKRRRVTLGLSRNADLDQNGNGEASFADKESEGGEVKAESIDANCRAGEASDAKSSTAACASAEHDTGNAEELQGDDNAEQDVVESTPPFYDAGAGQPPPFPTAEAVPLHIAPPHRSPRKRARSTKICMIPSSEPTEDPSDNIWQIFHTHDMLRDIVRHITHFSSRDHTLLLLDVIINQLEDHLNEEDAQKLLSELDWSSSGCATALNAPLTSDWSPRAWRVLARAQAISSRRGYEDFRMTWKCKLGEMLATPRSPAVSESDPFDWQGHQFVLALSQRHVVANRFSSLLLGIRLKPNLNQAQSRFAPYRVYARVSYVDDECVCGCNRREGYLGQETKPYTGKHESVHLSSLVGGRALRYTIMTSVELRRWMKRHSESCGIRFQVRLIFSHEVEKIEGCGSGMEGTICSCGTCFDGVAGDDELEEEYDGMDGGSIDSDSDESDC